VRTAAVGNSSWPGVREVKSQPLKIMKQLLIHSFRLARLCAIAGVITGLLIPVTAVLGAGGSSANSGGVNAGGASAGGANSGGLGGGGLGGGRVAGRTSLTFAAQESFGGVTPQCKGTVGITTYITTVTLDLLASQVSLPDGSQLKVTVNAIDYFTLKPWTPLDAGSITLTGGKGRLTVPSLVTTAPGRVPVVTSVVVSAPDGSILFIGH